MWICSTQYLPEFSARIAFFPLRWAEIGFDWLCFFRAPDSLYFHTSFPQRGLRHSDLPQIGFVFANR
jgi:hypothetical protein